MPTVNILTYILEDDIEVHDIMRIMLKEYGISEEKYRFHETPESFLAELNSDINICVIDHRLKGVVSGLEIIRQIKKKNKYSYVIVMSGQQRFDIGVRYLNEGANKYIDKNWSDKDLHEILGNWTLQRDPNYLDVLVKFLNEGFSEAEERVKIVKFLEQRISRD